MPDIILQLIIQRKTTHRTVMGAIMVPHYALFSTRMPVYDPSFRIKFSLNFGLVNKKKHYSLDTIGKLK